MKTNVVYSTEDARELQELYQTHWWFEGRELERIRRSVEHTDEFVALRDGETERLVASCRVITDYVYTGKILDVIVAESVRGQGLGTELMEAVKNHPKLQDVDELTLNCREGIAPFYETCDFRVHEMIGEHREGTGEDYYVMVHS